MSEIVFRADTDIAPIAQKDAGRRRGVRSSAPDEDLSRLGMAFATLDAALLAGNTSDTVYNRWWAAVRAALPIRAQAARGRRIKAKMLLAVMRETRADGVVCELARSVANDLIGRVGRKKRPLSATEIIVRYFVEQGLSRRAAGVLTACGCRDVDDVLRLDLGPAVSGGSGMTTLEFITGRVSSMFRVLAGGDVLVGFVRRDDDFGWIARTIGDPAGLRSGTVWKFPDRVSAVTWILARDQSGAAA
jgi:hypothetical protein